MIKKILTITVLSFASQCLQLLANADSAPTGTAWVIKPITAIAYNADQQRDPFQLELAVAKNTDDIKAKINLNVDNQWLFAQYPIGQLIMVGSISKANKYWALIKDPKGITRLINSDQYLGAEHSKITTITNTSVTVMILLSGQETNYYPYYIRLRDKND